MIHIRIGTKEDKCRSVYGILYDEDGDLFRSDATSFWTGILDGPTNIKGHTKSEVMALRQIEWVGVECCGAVVP